MEQRIIIIGGGVAGLSAAQAARETDPEAEIHLICGEKRLPYYRSRICSVMSGADPDDMQIRDASWFAGQRISVKKELATSVNQDERQLRFSDGSSLAYDKLILATGARPVKPETEGYERENVFVMHNLADAMAVRSFPGPAVVIGDGMLSLDAAWNLAKEGRSVVIVVRGKRLLPRQLDKEAALFLLYTTERAGLRIALRGEVASVYDDMVLLEDGRGFDASAVVLATGVKSDIRFGKKLGAMCGRGIVVDDHMHTTMPEIWAAGDCAEHNDLVCDNQRIAIAQGRVAGICAAGGDAVYEPTRPEYSLSVMGMDVWRCGDIDTEDSLDSHDAQLSRFIGLFFRDDILVGAELIGDVSLSQQLRTAMDEGMTKAEAEDIFLRQ